MRHRHPVGAEHLGLEVDDAFAGGNPGHHRVAYLGTEVRGEQPAERVADHAFGRAAEQALGGCAPGGIRPDGVAW